MIVLHWGVFLATYQIKSIELLHELTCEISERIGIIAGLSVFKTRSVCRITTSVMIQAEEIK